MSEGEWIILGVLGPIDLVFFYYIWRYRKAIETMLNTGIRKWLIERHRPIDLGDASPYCLACRKAWPCPEWAKLQKEPAVKGVEW